MLNFAWNQLKFSEKWGFELCGEYANPTFKTANRRKTQKVRELQLLELSSWTNCSRFRLFTNCTPLNPIMCVILPDRGITKIAETVLVSAICLILPFGFVTPERFIWNGVKYSVYQYVIILKNHGCSLFAHPDISMFFVFLQRKVSNNVLILGCFRS